MRKLIKFLMIAVVIFAVLLAGALIALKIMFPASKLKLMAQDYVKANFQRELNYKDVSLNLIGITINDFALSESQTFKQGTFISAKKLVVKVDFAALFDKRIEIQTVGLEGFKGSVIKDKDGKFNFDSLLALAAPAASGAPAVKAQQKKDSVPSNFSLIAKVIYLKNATLLYDDQLAGSVYTIRNINFKIDDFDFNDSFPFTASLITDIIMPGVHISPINIAAAGSIKLSDLVLKDASLDIDNLMMSYKTAKIAFNGSVSNFDNPAVVLKGVISGIDSNLLAEFAPDLPLFALPEIALSFNTVTDISGGFTKINNIKASIAQSYIITDGIIDYSKPVLSYNAKTKISISLTEIASVAKEMLAAFNLKGAIDGNITAKSGAKGPVVNGLVNFSGIGAGYEGKEVKSITGNITINSLTDIRTNLITGMFMGSPFKTSLAYKQLVKNMDISFFFNLEKFTLDDINFDTLFKPAPAKAPISKSASKEAAKTVVDTPRSVPMNINADISINKIENNIFRTDNLQIKANVKDFDNKMDMATGTLSFSTMQGEIRDIDKLMQSSVVLKLLLTSVRIVQNAFKVINMDKLSLGNNKITYTAIYGAYTLNNGLVTIDKSDINSDLTTVKATGTVNLLTEKLEMKIESHLGKVGAGGFKPIVIKVGGTLNNPSYKLDLASSVASIINIPGNVVKGTASGAGSVVKGVTDTTVNTVKGVADGVISIFKKKK